MRQNPESVMVLEKIRMLMCVRTGSPSRPPYHQEGGQEGRARGQINE